LVILNAHVRCTNPALELAKGGGGVGVHNDIGEGGVGVLLSDFTSSEGFGKLLIWTSLIGEGLGSRRYFS